MKKYVAVLLSALICFNCSFVSVLAEGEETPLPTEEPVQEASETEATGEELDETVEERPVELITSEEDTFKDDKQEETGEPTEVQESNETDAEISITIVFDSNTEDATGEMEPQTVVAGETVQLNPNQFEREGYEFACWTTEKDSSGVTYDDQQEILFDNENTSEIVLYAQWILISESEFEAMSTSDSDFKWADYGDGTISITKYIGKSSVVEVPASINGKTVWDINRSAFSGNQYIETVIVSEGIKAIGNEAFYNCSKLANVQLPDSLGSLGLNSFTNCSSLKEVVIPSNVMSLGYYAFSNCKQLTEITIPSSVSEISSSVVDGCDLLKYVNFCGTKSEWNNKYWAGFTPFLDNRVKSGKTIIRYNYKIRKIRHGGDPDPEEIYIMTERLEDILFSKTATDYNPKLSYVLSMMARSAYSVDQVIGNLKNLDFNTDDDSGDCIYDFRDDSTSGYIITKKEELEDGTTLVMIVIRGSYGWDWASDFDLGWGHWGYGWHQGFERSANQIYSSLEYLLGGIQTNKCKYVITGHSQGAGVGNLLAVKLSDAGVSNKDVYAYNFACPNSASGVMWLFNPDGKHDNIFNINNSEDPVSYLPGHVGHIGEFIGAVWSKYGKNLWFDPYLHSPAGHDMKYYVNYLSKLNPSSGFFSYDVISNIKRGFGSFCPVDMTVYDSSGNPVASVIDNQPNYYDSVPGEVIISVQEDEKIILVPNNDEYRVELSATDSGEMQYWAFDYDLAKGETLEEKIFDNIAIEPEKTMFSASDEQTEIKNIRLFVTDSDDTIVSEVMTDGTEREIIDGLYVDGLATNYTYTGSSIKPVFQVYDSGRLLKEKTDYTVAFKNNTKAGTATVTITGKGSYTAKHTETFQIDPVNLNETYVDEITVAQTAKPKKLTVSPKVTWNGKTLKAGTDYTIDYTGAGWDQMTAGSQKIKLIGKGNFTGTKEVSVNVTSPNQVSVTKLKVTPSTVNYEDGISFKDILDKVVVKDGKNDLKQGEHYEVSDARNCDRAGTCTFVLSGIGDTYYGRRTVSVTIKGLAISKAKASGNVTYTGTERTTENSPLVLMNGKTQLIEGTHYRVVSYTNNINAGTAAVMIEGLGNYSGTANVKFTIKPETKARFAVASDAVYSKGGAVPKVTVEGLTEGVDFTVTLSNNKAVAEKTANKAPAATIKFIGNYKGTPNTKAQFSIKPKNLNDVYAVMAEPVYTGKNGNYKTKITLTDTDGKALKEKTDYTVKYFNGTTGEEIVNTKTKLDETDLIRAEITGTGNYTGTVTKTCGFITKTQDISKATIKIVPQEYTGKAIILDKGDITATIKDASNKTVPIELGTHFKVHHYENNVNKGTAKAVLVGIPENGMGGTKTVSFKINQRSLETNWLEMLRKALGF